MQAMINLYSNIVCQFWIDVNHKVIKRSEMNTKKLTVNYGHVTLVVQMKIQVNRQVNKVYKSKI